MHPSSRRTATTRAHNLDVTRAHHLALAVGRGVHGVQRAALVVAAGVHGLWQQEAPGGCFSSSLILSSLEFIDTVV